VRLAPISTRGTLRAIRLKNPYSMPQRSFADECLDVDVAQDKFDETRALFLDRA
jgi:hypothetical protein